MYCKEIMAAEQTEEIVDVKSANEWESANMGDVSRKNKFLRLMGATKVTRPCFCCVCENNTEIFADI